MVDIGWQKYPINAQFHSISGYSAHADQKNLMDFVTRMKKNTAGNKDCAWW